METGYVYILDNVSMPKLLKIGATSRTPDARARELSISTGVPTPFVTKFSTRVSDWRRAEAAIHRSLDQYRPNKNREFFRLADSLAIVIVTQIAEQFKPQFTSNIKVPVQPDLLCRRCKVLMDVDSVGRYWCCW